MSYKVGTKYYSNWQSVLNDLKNINKNNYLNAENAAKTQFKNSMQVKNYIYYTNPESGIPLIDSGYICKQITVNYYVYDWHTDYQTTQTKIATSSTTETKYDVDYYGNVTSNSNTEVKYDTVTNTVKWIQIDNYRQVSETFYFYYKIYHHTTFDGINEATKEVLGMYHKYSKYIHAKTTYAQYQASVKTANDKIDKENKKIEDNKALHFIKAFLLNLPTYLIYLFTAFCVVLFILGIVNSVRFNSFNNGFASLGQPFIWGGSIALGVAIIFHIIQAIRNGAGTIPIFLFWIGIYGGGMGTYNFYGESGVGLFFANFFRVVFFVAHVACFIAFFHFASDEAILELQPLFEVKKKQTNENTDVANFLKKGGYLYYKSKCDAIQNM